MHFDEALAYLLSLGHETLTIKLGLHNIEILLEALGNPQQAFRSIQIAGTNGKGSTVVVVESILQTAGIRSGLYTSPHLISITERIKIDGHEISPETFARFAGQVRTTAEELVERRQLEAVPTFFEQVTAIALLAFREAKIELAILETGMGGRLDATTCAKSEIVAITPVALDHEEYLGETLEKVAAEKAAIMRPWVTAIIGPQEAAAQEVILRQCRLSNVHPIFDQTRKKIEDVAADGRFCVSLETSSNTYERVWLGLRGRHQIINVSLAVVIAEVLREKDFDIPAAAIIEGIQTAEHAGRLELIPRKPALMFDGAHNPAGAQTLRDYLVEFGDRPLTIVFGAMRDKKLRQMAELLFPLSDQLVLTEVENPRAATLDTLQQLAAHLVAPERIAAARSAGEALEIAREKTPATGVVCFTGSLYLIGAVRRIVLLEEEIV